MLVHHLLVKHGLFSKFMLLLQLVLFSSSRVFLNLLSILLNLTKFFGTFLLQVFIIVVFCLLVVPLRVIVVWVTSIVRVSVLVRVNTWGYVEIVYWKYWFLVGAG